MISGPTNSLKAKKIIPNHWRIQNANNKKLCSKSNEAYILYMSFLFVYWWLLALPAIVQLFLVTVAIFNNSFRITMITFLASSLLRQIIVLTKIFCGDTFLMYNCALRPHRPSPPNRSIIVFLDNIYCFHPRP